MANTFACTIVTPTQAVLDGQVNYASFPAWDGQMGVMPRRAPVLTKLGIGSLRLDFPEGGSRWFLIEGGFAEFHDDQLSILSDAATPAESILLSEAEAELAEASARVVTGATDRAAVERNQQRAMAKVALARAHQSRGGAI